VHYQLGVSPDLGRRRLSVVPQVPSDQHRVAGRHIRLGSGAVDVLATRSARRLRTVVRQTGRWRLAVGAVLPRGAEVRSVRVDGRPAGYRVQTTARGRVLVADGGARRGTTHLVVRLR
jgi:hypothetical protein